jgi:signal transduction histidine kinase
LKNETREAELNSLSSPGFIRIQREISSILARLFRYAPFLLATGSLFLLGWAGLLIVQHPYSGLSWSYKSGVVSYVDPQGPAAASFQIGDQILAIDGLPPYKARDLPGRQAGDRVAFNVERGQDILSIQLRLTSPGLLKMLTSLTTIPVALSFWLLGLLVLVFGPPGELIRGFFLFSQIFTLILSLGSISSYGPLWSGWVFGLLQWWIGPLTIQTHLLLANFRPSHNRERLLRFLYALALVFSLLDLLRLNAEATGPLLTVRYLWVGLTLLIAAGALFSASRQGTAVDNRRKTRIAGLAAFIAFLPFVLFSLLPEALFDQTILPYEVTFLALPILPLGYSYAILRYKLIRLERYVNRSAAYTLVILLVGAFYGLVYMVSLRVIDHGNRPVSLLEIGAMLLLILGAQPLYKLLQRWVDSIFYGGWYDDRAASKQISQALTQVEGDAGYIALTLCQALQKTMQLEYVDLLLNDGLLISTGASMPNYGNGSTHFAVGNVLEWFQALKSSTGREIGPGKELLEILPSPDLPQRWPIGYKPQLWLLLGGMNSPQGLLVLGARRGGGELNPADLEVLEVVIRQAGAALENASLLQEVRQQVEQNRALQRQVFRSRQEERKRLARDLHDRTIQALVGVNYQLAEARAQLDVEAGSKLSPILKTLRATLTDLRQVCAGLRPPALDALGLVPAIQSRVAELRAQVAFEIELDFDERLAGTNVSDDTALCIYRFFNEGIMNVLKHAAADWALVSMRLTEDDQIMISVEDDGQGFVLPAKLEGLVEQRHFGLVGLREQVEAAGGQVRVESSPGYGCRLTASIPLNYEG